MHAGKSLVDIAQELQRQVETRKDYLAPQSKIGAEVLEGEIVLDGLNGDPLAINEHAHDQIATHLGIPAKYYDRMRTEQPDLLARNINTWLRADGDNQRLVRTLDGKVRGFLSPRFRPLDNFDLASATLPTLRERKAQIVSVALTETRFYIKAILPELSDPLPEGLVWGSGHADITRIAKDFRIPDAQRAISTEQRGHIVAAIVISNSDVGAGTLRVEPSLFTTWCTNLAILVAAAMKKYHVGRSWEADSNFEVFSDETRKADDRAFFLKVQDVTKAAFSRESFDAALAQIKAAGTKQITSAHLDKVVEATVRELALPVGTQSDILSFLSRGGDLSQWGLSSAITAVAGQSDDYDKATQLEYAGGKVLALPDKQWDAIAAAA